MRNSGFFFQSKRGPNDYLAQEETSILIMSTQLLLRSGIIDAEKALFLEATANYHH